MKRLADFMLAVSVEMLKNDSQGFEKIAGDIEYIGRMHAEIVRRVKD